MRTTATSPYHFENRVDTDEVVRKTGVQLSWDLSVVYRDNTSAAIDRVAILVNRGIEDHRRSDLGTIGGGRRQAAVKGVLENHSSYIGRSSRHHGKQAGP